MIDRRDLDHSMRRRAVLTAAAAIFAVAGVGLVVALGLGGDDAGGSNGALGTRPFERQDEAARDTSSRDPEPAGRYPVALVKRKTVLYEKPRGKRKVTIAARTRWGSPRKLSVVRRRGGWLAVLVPELENGEVGWIEHLPQVAAYADRHVVVEKSSDGSVTTSGPDRARRDRPRA